MEELYQIIDKLKRKEPLLKAEHKLLLNHLNEEGGETDVRAALYTHWDDLCQDESLVLKEPDELFYKIFYKAREQEKKPQVKVSIGQWIQRIAAVMLLPLLLTTAWYFGNDNEKVELTEEVTIYSPADSKTRFFLPDGTQGWLHAGSQLHFSYSSKKIRAVSLEGQAYFDVSENKEKPFIVSTNDFKIKVLGTRFNVLADTLLPVAKVFLEEGSIQMLGLDDKPQTLLQPGEQYLFNREVNNFSVVGGGAEEALAWTQGVLLLKNKSLKEAAQALESFYNVDIEIVDKELEEMPVYAKIQNEKLDEVLEMTKLILPISYKIERSRKRADGSFSKRKVVIQKSK